MPDIQTAMQEALKKTARAWAADDDSDAVDVVDVPTDEKSGSTLKTFNCIRDNPGKTRQAIFEMLTAAGVKKGSITSLLSQMIARGNVREVGGLLYAAQDTYEAIRPPQRLLKHLLKRWLQRLRFPQRGPSAMWWTSSVCGKRVLCWTS